MYTVIVDHLLGHNQESFLNYVSFTSFLVNNGFMNSSLTSLDRE